MTTWQTPNGKIEAFPALQLVGLYTETGLIEALDSYLNSGRLYGETRKGTLWQLRRNGKTKRWKRQPGRLEIPVKAGFRDCFTIDNRLSYIWVRGVYESTQAEADPDYALGR